MSSSILYGIKKDFHGEEIFDFQNSWAFCPQVWQVLFEKYTGKSFENETFLTAVMFDEKVFSRLNRQINNNAPISERILWELSNQQIFYAKDKMFVADMVELFWVNNNFKGFIKDRAKEIANQIRNLSSEYEYFVLKATTVDDAIENIFDVYDEDLDDYVKVPLRNNSPYVEFVVIDDENKVSFISNRDFDFSLGGIANA